MELNDNRRSGLVTYCNRLFASGHLPIVFNIAGKVRSSLGVRHAYTIGNYQFFADDDEDAGARLVLYPD